MRLLISLELSTELINSLHTVSSRILSAISPQPSLPTAPANVLVAKGDLINVNNLLLFLSNMLRYSSPGSDSSVMTLVCAKVALTSSTRV